MFKLIRNAINYWYIPVISGIILIVLGVIVLLTPEASFLSLAILFTIGFSLNGLLNIFFAVSNRKVRENRGLGLVIGIFQFIIGLLLLTEPSITALTLAMLLAFVILFISAGLITTAFELKKYWIKKWWYVLALGVLGVTVSFIMLRHPEVAGFTIILRTGIAIIAVGCSKMMVGLQLKKLHDLPSNISNEARELYSSMEQKMKDEMDKWN